jgi:hypothetical protein
MTLSELKAQGRKEFEEKFSRSSGDFKEILSDMADFLDQHTETVARVVKEELLPEEDDNAARQWARAWLLTKWNTFMGEAQSNE